MPVLRQAFCLPNCVAWMMELDFGGTEPATSFLGAVEPRCLQADLNLSDHWQAWVC